MRFQLPTLALLFATTAHLAEACLVYQATISYDNGYMAGTTVDNGVQTCSEYNIGTGQDPNQWYWGCISGYSMRVYNGGLTAAYCNPSNCYTFAINCNYATNIIGCGAAVFGC